MCVQSACELQRSHRLAPDLRSPHNRDSSERDESIGWLNGPNASTLGLLRRCCLARGKKAGSLGFRQGMGPIHNELGSPDTELKIWKFWLCCCEIGSRDL